MHLTKTALLSAIPALVAFVACGAGSTTGNNGGGSGTSGLTLNVAGVGSVPFSSVTQISQ